VLIDDQPFEVTSGAIHRFVSWRADDAHASYALVNDATRSLTHGTTLCGDR
jgi:hypothetical protein